MHPILEKHLKKNKLAHAYLLIGKVELDNTRNFLLKILDSESSAPHPDFFVYWKEIGINNIRSIKQKAYNTPLLADKKIFLINADNLNRASQNALLKVLEDTPKKTYFFLIVSNEGKLLPTIISRVVKLHMPQYSKIDKNVEKFINAPYKEKLDKISDIDEEFVKNLQDFITDKKNFPDRTKLLTKLQKVYNLIKHKIISPKMYLEYISILLEKP